MLPSVTISYCIKNFRVYSDKIIISVLNLTQINNATVEDRACKLDLWASAFKANTWEELLMLAQKDEAINEMVVTYRDLTADEMERLKAFAEEDRIRTENGFRYEIQKRDEVILQKNEALLQKDEALLQKDEALLQKDAEIEALKKQLANLRKQ